MSDHRLNVWVLFRKFEIMVDSAFSEWDNTTMFNHLQQRETGTVQTGRQAGIAVRHAPLKANASLLLALSIIPTPSGVTLIA
jgi:hypothetical protein